MVDMQHSLPEVSVRLLSGHLNELLERAEQDLRDRLGLELGTPPRDS